MEKNNALIYAVSECFAVYGYHKATMKVLTTLTDLSSSSFYHHYKSKGELFKDVIEFEIDQLRNLIAKAVEKQTNPSDKLQAYFQSRILGIQQMKNLLQVVNDEKLLHKHYIETLSHKYQEIEEEFIKQILQWGSAEGTFRVLDSSFEVCAIASTIQTIQQTLNQYHGIEHSKEKLNNFVNILLFGVVKDYEIFDNFE